MRVIVIHRRLYIKLPSVHSELYMADTRPIVDPHAFLPIVDWIERADAHVRGRFNQTVALRDQFARLGAKVGVMDLHALPPTNRALLSHFVCAHMRARATCALIRSDVLHLGVNKNVRPRARASLYDLVYGAALAANMPRIDQAAAVGEMMAALRERPQLAAQIPLRCLPPTELDRIWTATVDEERALAPGGLSAVKTAELKRHFAEAAASALCSANTSAALARPGWATVLGRAVKTGTL